MSATEQTPEARAAERQMRQAIRKQVMAVGVPANKADEIVDLAFHGAEKAMDALVTTTRASSDSRVSLNAMVIASSLIDEKMKGMRELAGAMAGAAGLNLTSAMVEVGGQPS